MESIATEKKPFLFNPQDPKVNKFFKDASNNFKMKLLQLSRVPGAFWFRLKMEEVNQDKCIVSLPLSWRTKNPFQSIYFVGLMAAAEYSTALLVYSRVMMAENVKYIVKDVGAEFVKKASSRTFFTCDDPASIDEAINQAIITGEQHSVKLYSTGRLSSGEVVAKIHIAWTFKYKE